MKRVAVDTGPRSGRADPCTQRELDNQPRRTRWVENSVFRDTWDIHRCGRLPIAGSARIDKGRQNFLGL